MRAVFLAISIFVSSFAAWGAITGTVVGGDGRAIASAKVAAFALETSEEQRVRWVSADPARKPLVTGATDANGRFSIDPKATVVDLRVEVSGQPAIGVRSANGEDAGVLQAPSQPLVRGTVTANGKPLPDATVIVRSGGAEGVATTDAHGQYWLPDPKKLVSWILVQHTGYAPVEREIDTVALRNPDVAMTAGIVLNGRVVAADGETPVAGASIQIDDLILAKTGADGTFAIEHAPAGARRIAARAGDRISARLIGGARQFLFRLGSAAAISGSIRDIKSGIAIAGAQVTAAAPRYGGLDPGAWSVTDDKGNFTIAGLAGGEYELNAVHPGYATPRLVVNAPPGVTVRKTLYAAALARISGSVIDEGARAVAGVSISTRRVGGDMLWTPSSVRMTSRAITAPNGHFILRIAEDGNVQLDATKTGMPAAHSGIIRVAPGSRTADIVITLPRGVALAGRVIAPDAKPVSGAAVTATEPGAGGVRDAEEGVRTKADGTFAVRVRGGTYDVTVTAAGFAPRTVRTQVTASTPPLEVTLEAGVEISGRVTCGETPVDGVDIFIISGGDAPPVQTSADGRFRIIDLAPGQVTLAFKKPTELIQATRTVTAPAADVNVEVPAGGRIAGRVIDKGTSQPVTSFDAGITRGSAALMRTPAMRAFTSDDGTFAIDGAPVGSQTLSVTAPGYVMARVPNINVESGKSVEGIEVALDHGVRVSGHVTGPDGGPAGGVLVRVDPTTSTRGATTNDSFTLTDPDGAYALDSLDAGPTTLAFSRSGLVTVRKSVTLSGSSSEVDAQLGAGSSIAGVVVLDGGAPVAGADVRAFSATDTAGMSSQTDEGGTFVIAGAPAGHYEISATRAGYGSATLRDVEIPAPSMLRLVINRGGVITGAITGLTRAELQSASVQAWSADGATASASPDESGHYRIEGAAAGSVRVGASVKPLPGSARNAVTKVVQLDAGATVNVDFDFTAEIIINGRITRNGRPLPGVEVSFAPQSAALRYARSAADGNGRYEISGIDNGSYAVTVYDTEQGPYSTVYEVKGSSTFDIDLRGVRVAGRVSDATTDAAIANARVDLLRTDGNASDVRSTLSDASGGFSFDQVAAGRFEARVQKASYGAAAVPVTVGQDGVPPLEVKLSPSQGVAIRVIDARDGQPLNGWYHAESAAGESYDGAIAGTAEPAPIALAAGSYRITIGAAAYAPRTMIIVAPGEQTVALTPGGTIVVSSSSESVAALRIIDAAGQPVHFGPGPAAGMVRLDPAPGQTRIANVAAGTYTLQIVADGRVLRSALVTVREAETVSAKL
ncbi:MAG TPA: carboxypeptidase-like regulatory domain-containing protein [Thermoanaerobaculia bacterium]|nr:carboxypeptidase-like regulatory domain-containing protein [Thermoanaerobaculia bacterium]